MAKIRIEKIYPEYENKTTTVKRKPAGRAEKGFKEALISAIKRGVGK